MDTTEPVFPNAVQRALKGWYLDRDLASVRDGEALARLPAGERRRWQELWADLAKHLAEAESASKHVRELERQLGSLFRRETKPADVRELITVARLATHWHREYAATARLLGQTLEDHPAWAEQLPADPLCYYAACCAAMAASGEGVGAGGLDATERRRLRLRAVAWLRDELNRQSKRFAEGTSLDRAAVWGADLAHWKVDGWLKSLRDKDAVAQLPADERQACEKLWADVAVLLAKTQPKK